MLLSRPAVDSVLIHMERLSEPFLYPKESRHLIRKFSQNEENKWELLSTGKPRSQRNLELGLRVQTSPELYGPNKSRPTIGKHLPNWFRLSMQPRNRSTLLNFLPLPQGQGSFRPTLGASRTTGLQSWEFRGHHFLPLALLLPADQQNGQTLGHLTDQVRKFWRHLIREDSIFSKAAKLVDERNMPRTNIRPHRLHHFLKSPKSFIFILT